MKQEGLKERVELLEAGEKLGYPRLGYGRSTKIPHDKRIPQGQPGWEKFCAHAHIRRVLPALRIARVLRDNGVQVFHPLTAAEMAPVNTVVIPPEPAIAYQPGVTVAAVPPDLLEDIALLPLPTNPVLPVDPARRPKRGGHKKPPHPNSKRKPRA